MKSTKRNPLREHTSHILDTQYVVETSSIECGKEPDAVNSALRRHFNQVSE